MSLDDYGPFIQDDENLSDKATMEAQLAYCSHPHLGDLVQRKTFYINQHALLHIAGQEGSPQHEECIEAIRECEVWGERAFQAIWN